MGRNGLNCAQESPGSAHNEIEGPLVEIGPRSVFDNRRSVSCSRQRGRVVGGSGEWRVASGGRIVASEVEQTKLAAIKKRQNKAKLLGC